MKVYCKEPNVDIDFDEQYTRHVIYSNEGIYCNQKTKLTQIIYEDASEDIHYKNHHFYVDKSVEKFGEVITHIPFEHLYCEEHYAKKHIGYDIQYVRCRYFDQTSYYFELSTISDLQLDTIISFLSIE